MRKRFFKKIKKNWKTIFFAFFIGVAFGFLISASFYGPNKIYVSEKLLSEEVNSSENRIKPDYIYSNICMKCHIAPEKYKSFTTYFGRSADVWKIGVNKMISSGNVKLKPEEVEAVADYLASLFGGGV